LLDASKEAGSAILQEKDDDFVSEDGIGWDKT
jgi:hypothetical protein